MNAEKCCEAFSDAEKYRLKGNQQFLAKPPQYAEAIESYTYSIKQYERCGCDNEDATKTDKIKALNNRSLCYFNLKKWRACEHDCNAAISLDLSHCKAWGRRGHARYEQKVWNGTVSDFCQFQKLNGGRLDAAMNLKLAEAKRHLEMETDMQLDRWRRKLPQSRMTLMVRQLIPAREARTTHEWRKMTSGLRPKTEASQQRRSGPPRSSRPRPEKVVQPQLMETAMMVVLPLIPGLTVRRKGLQRRRRRRRRRVVLAPRPTTAPTATRLKSVASSLGCAVDVNSRDTAAVPARKLTGGGVTKIIV